MVQSKQSELLQAEKYNQEMLKLGPLCVATPTMRPPPRCFSVIFGERGIRVSVRPQRSDLVHHVEFALKPSK